MIVENCKTPCIDGVFVLDVSRSLGNNVAAQAPFDVVKDFIARTINSVTISPTCSRAALLLFANSAKILFNLNSQFNTDNATLQEALNDIRLTDADISDFRQSAGTNTPKVLELLRKESAPNGSLGVDNENRVQIAIIITDGRPSLVGVDNIDSQTEEAGRLLREEGIYEQIYAIGVQGRSDRPINDTILERITGSSETAFLIDDFRTASFQNITRDITAEFCNRE